ncbi:MAG: ABC transporter ATP-binding protein [Acidimicrobiia bacterium]|nr:ABC transporter ATP-binding protein [Acidimicrobiia bacterium]MDH5420604.1 ABC transporter ATP-binding protein [Acidimicrobiia bacterium]MDH5503980.1 ABC transporter ATP-binding protein [Acidimicrobiia bacterium]
MHPPRSTPVTSPAARAVGATKIYGQGDTKVTALNDVSVDFARGQFTAIMGPSGSGKSTLMHCLAALDDLTEGSVYLGEIELTGMGDRELTELRRDKIGFIFQSFNLIPTLTAKENIVLPASIAGRTTDKEWFDQVIEILGIGDRLSHRPSEMSGGQQQRVAAARALASRPEIIFGDEPSGNLDSKSGAELLGFMRQAVDEHGQTIVMVTHDAISASYADRIVFLGDGKIVDEMLEPTAEKILDRIKTLEA